MKFAITPVTAFSQNCTLLWCEQTRRGALVDPGGDIEALMSCAQHHQVAIESILVTHGHIDHVGAVDVLAQQLHIPIYGPEKADQFWIDQLQQQSQYFGFAPSASFTPTRWLTQGDTVQVGNQNLQVLHTPGHTPGHICFFHAASKLAIVGDVLFAGSIGRTDFPMGNHADLIKAIRTKLFPLGDDVRFIPGHGPMSTFGEERMDNPFVSDAAVGGSV